MSEVHHDHYQFQWFTRKTYRTWRRVVFIAKIYDQEDTRRNQEREKVHVAKFRGNQVQTSKNLLPEESQRMCLIPQQLFGTKHMESCLPGMLTRDSVPKFLLEVDHIGIYCLAHTKNFRLPEKSRCYHKSCCLYSLVTVSHFDQLGWWEPSQKPSFQMPTKGQPCKQTLQRILVRPATLTPLSMILKFLVFPSI